MAHSLARCWISVYTYLSEDGTPYGLSWHCEQQEAQSYFQARHQFVEPGSRRTLISFAQITAAHAS